LLTVLACVAAGLWMIAVKTPDARPQLSVKSVHTTPPGSTPASRDFSQNGLGSIVFELEPAPISIEAGERVPLAAPRERLDDTAHLARGRELRHSQQLEDALAHIREIDERGPLARVRWANEVGILCDLQRTAEALLVSNRWLATHPDDRQHLRRSCVRHGVGPSPQMGVVP
jgi:hypothetical protein